MTISWAALNMRPDIWEVLWLLCWAYSLRAVDAAINSDPEGYIKFITDEIKLAIGDETDDYKACCLNVKRSVALIEHSLDIQQIEEQEGLRVVGAMYHIEDGSVEFL